MSEKPDPPSDAQKPSHDPERDAAGDAEWDNADDIHRDATDAAYQKASDADAAHEAGRDAAEAATAEVAAGPKLRKRKSRRVTTPHPEGSDPSPTPEPPRTTGTENDDRLRADKPPHWG